MEEELMLKRVDNPEGHQVCQVDQTHKTVAIQNKRYKTLIRFEESGELKIQHLKVEKQNGQKAACS